MCTELLDLLLENIQFAFGEPITLVFLPYFTHKKECDGIEGVCADHTDDGGPYESGVVDGLANVEHPIWDEWSRKYLRLLDMDGEETSDRLGNGKERRKQIIDLLTEETEKLHKTTSSVLLEFSSCHHGTVKRSNFPCDPCCKKLDQCGKDILQQNATMATMINEVVRSGRCAPVLSIESYSIVHELIDAKMEGLAVYKNEVASKLDKSVVNYWKTSGHFCKTTYEGDTGHD